MNEYVEHKKYGRGLIIREESGRVTVEFETKFGMKMFQFPEAFEDFLMFENQTLQEECLVLRQAKKQQIAEENERKHEETLRQEKEKKKEVLDLKKSKAKVAKDSKTKVVKANKTKSERYEEEPDYYDED
jgi:hypothetical protein